MEFAMKKLILAVVLGLSLGSVSAFAYDSRYDNRGADVGRWSVPWENRYVVAKREKFLANSVKQKIDISARQIPPTDAAGKEHVATDQQIVLARKEAKAAWTMTGHFEHLKFRSKKI